MSQSAIDEESLVTDRDTASERLSGQPYRRREDAAFLRGRATYTDDHSPPDTVHLEFARSTRGHADIEAIDTRRAEATSGVLGVYTWDDFAATETPAILPLGVDHLDYDVPGHPLLARDRVRYHGQPVAAVVATDRYRARDGAEAVTVTYGDREAVVDPVEATQDHAPLLYENVPDNVIVREEMGDEASVDRAFTAADRTVKIALENNRLIPNALEPRVALASYDAGSERFTVELASQSAHGHRQKLSHTLGVPERKLRVIAPAVGGGFGHKGHHHPGEAMAAWCARDLDRPVKWTATRSENYLEGAHGRDHQTEAEIAFDETGHIRALRVSTIGNVGAYGLGGSAGITGRYGALLSSEYAIPAIYCSTEAVFTNTAPIHSYRGAGRPEAIYVTERLVDVAARDVGIDPAEFRRRNLISPDEFPYETAVGTRYDSGDYEIALDRALDLIGYEPATDRNETDDGRLHGVGVACYTESTGGGYESGVVRVHPDGGVSVYVGTHSHGQGHETTYSQVVADALEVPYDSIDVHYGDTERVPKGTGTFGSRSTIMGGNAVAESAHKVREKARQLAAAHMDVDSEAVTYSDAIFRAENGNPQEVAFNDVAGMAYGWGVPAGLDPGLEATTFYQVPGAAYTFGTHAASVAIDRATGEMEILEYVAVDDCGERINPLIVEGQVHGGVAQGIGQARSERTVYDGDGRLLTDTMIEYALPRANDLPDFTTDKTITPSPLNELGVKGIGEAGTIAAPPTIVNAVVDALAPFGIDHVDMPVTDEQIWQAIKRSGNP